jgi:hypothetical protein
MAGRLGVIGGNSASEVPSGRLGRIEVSKQVLEDEAKRRKRDEARKQAEKMDAEVKKSQDAVFDPKNVFSDIAKAAGNATAAVNEKVLGGAVKAGVKVFNTVTSGFNNKEADKKTDAFLKSAKQVNDRGESTIATGKGVNRNDEAFKVGEDVGNLVKSNTVDMATAPLKGVKSVYDQAKMSTEIQSRSSGINKGAIDKLIKFVDEDEKAGKLTKTQADAKRKHLTDEANKTTKATTEAEQRSGVEFDQTAGVTNLLATAAEVAGLKGVPKKLANKVETSLVSKFGSKKSDDIATEVPVTVDEAQPEIVKARSEAYEPDETKPRISMDEAKQKLADSGYSKDESTRILEDALPDKGLSMPGSPKNIGLNESSIIDAARNLDNVESTRSVVETPEAIALKSVARPSPSDGTNLTPLRALDGSAEQGVSRLGKSVQEKAIENKIISRVESDVEDLPTYTKANMKQQAEYSNELIKTNPQEAIDIAMGRKSPPDHVLPQMVFNAVEEHAKKIGGEAGGKLLKDLARSRQVSNLTTMAQNVRAAAEREPHSPVTLMNDLRTTRAQQMEKRGKKISKEEQADRKIIKAARPKVKKETWDSFIKELEC